MRDKLIELLEKKYDHYCDQCGVNKQSHYIENLADHLIANGVTFAECLVDTNKTFADVPDTNVGKWIPVSERLPEPFVSVLVQMPGEEPCPTVREGFMTNDGDWYAGYFARLKDEVSHWMPMPEPPKDGE